MGIVAGGCDSSGYLFVCLTLPMRCLDFQVDRIILKTRVPLKVSTLVCGRVLTVNDMLQRRRLYN